MIGSEKMANDKVEVTNGNVTKTIERKDLADYIACGWTEVVGVKENPFWNVGVK